MGRFVFDGAAGLPLEFPEHRFGQTLPGLAIPARIGRTDRLVGRDLLCDQAVDGLLATAIGAEHLSQKRQHCGDCRIHAPAINVSCHPCGLIHGLRRQHRREIQFAPLHLPKTRAPSTSHSEPPCSGLL